MKGLQQTNGCKCIHRVCSMQVTSLKRLLDDDIMEHLEHITELSDRCGVVRLNEVPTQPYLCCIVCLSIGLHSLLSQCTSSSMAVCLCALCLCVLFLSTCSPVPAAFTQGQP